MGAFKKLFQMCKAHAQQKEVGLFCVLLDFMFARILHGFSIDDYFFNTDGYSIKNFQRKSFFSNKRWLKVRRLFNDPNYTYLLDNKIETLQLFAAYIKHDWLNPANATFEDFKHFVKTHPRILLKPISDEGGHGIILYKPESDIKSEYQKLCAGGWLLEECISQSPQMSFNNESVNTVRVYTIMDNKGEPHILKTCLRAGVGNSIVDNFHSGGVIYPINVEGGFVELYGESRLGQDKIFVHPGSNIMMLGFKVPHWDILINTVKQMAKAIPQVRYVGWDMVVTEDGVDFIEANDNADPALFGRFGVERFFYKIIMQYR